MTNNQNRKPGCRAIGFILIPIIYLAISGHLYAQPGPEENDYQLVVWPFEGSEGDSSVTERIANELIGLDIEGVTIWDYEDYRARSINPQRRIEADGHLKGKIVRFGVTEPPVESTSKSRRYQSGTTERRNPAYDRLEFDIDELARREEDARRNLEDRQEKEQRIKELDREQRDLEREIKNGISELERMNRKLRSMQSRNASQEEIGQLNERFDDESRRLKDLDRERKSIKDEMRDLSYGPGLFSLEREFERAQSAHNYAKRDLRTMPEVVEEPVYEDYRYEVRLYRIRSYAELQYQLDETRTQDPIVRTISVELSEEDEEIAESNREAGIERDPKELPGQNEMRERIFQNLLTKLISQLSEDLK